MLIIVIQIDLTIKRQHMRLIRFLSLLEKIIIALIILCFIPTALFAYLPHAIVLPQELQSAYKNVVEQASHSGFLTTTAAGNNCSSQHALAIKNQLCLDRCTIGKTCSILQATQPCSYANNYVVGQVKVCSTTPVLNKFVPADTVAFEPDHQSLPLDRAYMDPDIHLLFEPYCIANLNQCRTLTNQLGKQGLQENFSDNYNTFFMLVQYLMFFGLLPLIIHTVVVFILDSCGKYNLRLTNSLMIIHQALIGAAIIIAGITFNLNNDSLQSSINKFSTNCLINSNQCQKISLPFSTFKADDGVSSTFVTIMCFVLAIQALLLVGVVVLNVLMVKYYKLRELQPTFSGYELQTL